MSFYIPLILRVHTSIRWRFHCGEAFANPILTKTDIKRCYGPEKERMGERKREREREGLRERNSFELTSFIGCVDKR